MLARRVQWRSTTCTAPNGRFSHPQEEYLLSLIVEAGASETANSKVYDELLQDRDFDVSTF